MTYWEIKPKRQFVAKGEGGATYEVLKVTPKSATIRLVSKPRNSFRVVSGIANVNRQELAKSISHFVGQSPVNEDGNPVLALTL